MTGRYSGGGIIPFPNGSLTMDLPSWLAIDLADIPDEDETCTYPACTRRGEWLASCHSCGARARLLPDGRRPIACTPHRKAADRRARRKDRADRRRGLRFVCYRCHEPLVPVRWVHV